MTTARRLLPLLAFLPAAALSAAELSLTPQGVAVRTGGALGTLTLDYPALTRDGDGTRRAPEKVALDGNIATLGYPGGAQITLTLAPDGTAQLHATGLAASDKGVSLNMTLPVSLAGKARWSIKESVPAPLPPEKGADAFLWRGDATRFTLTDDAGKGLSVVIEHGYQQLQDNRVWNTDAFQWVSFSALPRAGGGEAYFKFHLLDAGAPVPAAAPAAPAAPAPKPKRPTAEDRLALGLSDKGADLACGSMGTFTLEFPSLDFGDGKKREPVEKRVQGASATLTYEGGEIGRASCRESG